MTLEGLILCLKEMQDTSVSKDAVVKIFDADCGSFEEITGFVFSEKEITFMSNSEEELKP